MQMRPRKNKLFSNLALSSKPYPIPHVLYNQFKEKVKELLEKGIIKRSISPITSPVFVARKGDNDVRLLVDFRKVNKHITDDNYFFPGIFDNIEALKGMKFFSKIDLTTSFYQIPVAEEHQEITSFTSPIGQYKFTRLPFGLKSSPKLFQRTISGILSHFTNIIIFVDDILLFNSSGEEHIENIQSVINTLQNHNLEINFDKCLFMKPEINFLGMNINGDGYRADLSKLKESISNFIPKTKKGYQKLAGYLGFFRSFVPNISELMFPTTEAIKGNVDEKKILESRNLILKKIKKNVVIVFPESKENFKLQTDSSNKTCSAILSQSHGIIGLFSHKFSETESRYNIMEKEFLAILLSLRKFKYIILGNLTKVFTDNKNILYDTSIECSRVQRWKLMLSEFNIEMVHIKGSENFIPDLMSRVDSIDKVNENTEDVLKLLNTLPQPSDREIAEHELEKKENSTYFLDKKRRIFVPEESKERFINELHRAYGHPGSTSMYYTVRNYLFIVGIKKSIEKISKSCQKCSQNKITKHKYGIITGSLASTKIHEKLFVDHLGPFTNSSINHDLAINKFWFFVATESFSKYTKIYFVKTLKPKETMNALSRYIKLIGNPEKIISDQGRTFLSREFEQYLDERKIIHIKTRSYNPQSNSLVERRNRIILETMKMYEFSNIKDYIAIVEKRLNFIICTSTGYTPAQLMLKSNPFDIDKKDNYTTILNNATQTQEKNNFLYNKALNKQRIYHSYKPGDLVLVKNMEAGKLTSPYSGPFSVLEVSKNFNSLLVDLVEKVLWVNIKNAKPFGF